MATFFRRKKGGVSCFSEIIALWKSEMWRIMGKDGDS